MPEPKLQFIMSGHGADQRKIAVMADDAMVSDDKPPILWLGGFRSDMRATKADALAKWAALENRRFVRFDYSGHGASENQEAGGRFADGTISRWLEDTLAVMAHFALRRPVLVGSSMGGWLALLVAERLAFLAGAGLASREGPELASREKPDVVMCGPEDCARQPSALVLIAPAVDFTEELMWQNLPDSIRHDIMLKGQWLRPSAYSAEPYPITRGLIEDGRKNLLFGKPIVTHCPVHILQGMNDPDVPHPHALKLMEHLPGEGATLTLIKDGDHRLSREQDIALLIEAVSRAVAAPQK